MMRNLKFHLCAVVAIMLLALGSLSCAREDEESLDSYVGALPPKQSAIQKHIVYHKKERTRSGELVKLDPVVYEGDTVIILEQIGVGDALRWIQNKWFSPFGII